MPEYLVAIVPACVFIGGLGLAVIVERVRQYRRCGCEPDARCHLHRRR